jgi:1-deoxy-D-xylulose-5-phosphate synthase
VKDEVWNLLGKMNKLGKTAQELVSQVQSGVQKLIAGAKQSV